MWKRVFEEYRKKLYLTGEESALIGEAGGALFGRSEEENHRRLTLILEQLDDRIKTVRGELGEKQKIYATVSMVLGGNARHSSDLGGRKAKQKGMKYDEREFDF